MASLNNEMNPLYIALRKPEEKTQKNHKTKKPCSQKGGEGSFRNQQMYKSLY